MVVPVEVRVAYSSKKEVLSVGILHVSLINITVNLVDPLMLHFRLLIEVSPSIVITLVTTVVIL